MKKIFTKDWLELHPYASVDTTDVYYTNIANSIYEILETTGMVNSFEPEESKQIAIRMAAYFEDVISKLGIWSYFINEQKKLTGNYLPFYTISDRYYDDEANYEDVRFLLWHFTQQYHGFRKGTFVNPDNPANDAAGQLIYNLFCDEWTTAPENEKMQNLFNKETRYDSMEKYQTLLEWFHYHSYLLTDTNDELQAYIKQFMGQAKKEGKELQDLIFNLYHNLAFDGQTVLFAHTSPESLLHILPEDHPDREMSKQIADESVTSRLTEEGRKKNAGYCEKFKAAADDQPLTYFENMAAAVKFIIEEAKIDKEEVKLPANNDQIRVAAYARPDVGVQLIIKDVEVIKDEKNPYYDAQAAAEKAISFFIVRHCDYEMLEELEKNNMLADAHTKSLESEGRGYDIIHQNWQFMARYFLRERPASEYVIAPEKPEEKPEEKEGGKA